MDTFHQNIYFLAVKKNGGCSYLTRVHTEKPGEGKNQGNGKSTRRIRSGTDKKTFSAIRFKLVLQKTAKMS